MRSPLGLICCVWVLAVLSGALPRCFTYIGVAAHHSAVAGRRSQTKSSDEEMVTTNRVGYYF